MYMLLYVEELAASHSELADRPASFLRPALGGDPAQQGSGPVKSIPANWAPCQITLSLNLCFDETAPADAAISGPQDKMTTIPPI